MFLCEAGWSQHIPVFLGLLGRAARVSRAHLFRLHTSPDGRVLTSKLYEWADQRVEPQIGNPPLQNLDLAAAGYQRWIELLQRGEPVDGNVRAALIVPLVAMSPPLPMAGRPSPSGHRSETWHPRRGRSYWARSGHGPCATEVV